MTPACHCFTEAVQKSGHASRYSCGVSSAAGLFAILILLKVSIVNRRISEITPTGRATKQSRMLILSTSRHVYRLYSPVARARTACKVMPSGKATTPKPEDHNAATSVVWLGRPGSRGRRLPGRNLLEDHEHPDRCDGQADQRSENQKGRESPQ